MRGLTGGPGAVLRPGRRPGSRRLRASTAGLPLRARAVLFDLDGVLVDSRECIARVWREWAAPRGLDPEPFLRVAHGRRISETIALVAPRLDARAEAAALDAMEEIETRGLVAFDGAARLLAALEGARWGVVTSGSRAVATLRLGTAGLPVPAVFVTADDVVQGKPDPECYRAAARHLAVAPPDCIVVEDSPTGVAAATAAGMRVVAVLTTHPATALAGADVRVTALSALDIRHGAGGSLEVTEA